MKLSILFSAAGIMPAEQYSDVEITNIETDVRRINTDQAQNTIFVCVSGAKYDTHNDISKLLKAGTNCIIAQIDKTKKEYQSIPGIILCENSRIALAALSRAFYGFPDKKLKIVGITGTKGKTTTSYMLASICESAGQKCGIIGTNGVSFDGKKYETSNSTPGSLELFAYLCEMAERKIEYVFCEVTSQAQKQYRTYGIEFDLAVFTNLFPDHIGKDEHSNYEEYADCKTKIFENCKYALLNGEDKEYERFSAVCVKNKKPYELFYPSKQAEKISEHLKMPGDYNVSNAVCAFFAARHLGFGDDDILKGIENVNVPGRCERVEVGCGVSVIIDYAHSGESLENVLKGLRSTCRGKIICVFGAGGDRSPLRRHGMGSAAVNYADYSVVTNDNPRTEEPSSIIDDILSGMKGFEDKYTVITDRKDAIFYALSIARKGDTVLLAGKGAQNYEEINGVRYPFDEREVVREYYSTMNLPK